MRPKHVGAITNEKHCATIRYEILYVPHTILYVPHTIFYVPHTILYVPHTICMLLSLEGRTDKARQHLQNACAFGNWELGWKSTERICVNCTVLPGIVEDTT